MTGLGERQRRSALTTIGGNQSSAIRRNAAECSDLIGRFPLQQTAKIRRAGEHYRSAPRLQHFTVGIDSIKRLQQLDIPLDWNREARDPKRQLIVAQILVDVGYRRDGL